MPQDEDRPLTPAQARQKLQQGIRDYLAGNGQGSIVFRLKRTKKASYLFPLKLTEQQREVLLRLTQRLTRNLKNKLKEAGAGTQLVGVTWIELDTLNDRIGEALVTARNTDKKRLWAVMDRVGKFFEEEHAGVFENLHEGL